MGVQPQQRVRVASNADVLASIGNTPLFRLRKMATSGMAEVWVKWEGANPTGSMKDRMALSMVEGAEKRGQLKPGGTVVEWTGGSTGSSLAMVCAAKGYRSHFISSDAFADEKIATMRVLGGTVEIIPSKDRKMTPELFQKMIARAKELSKEPNTFWTDQLNNPDNKAAYHKMAEEILESIGSLDAWVMSAGTGGCFSGNAEVFKERLGSVRCVAGEPASSRHLSGGVLGGHSRLGPQISCRRPLPLTVPSPGEPHILVVQIIALAFHSSTSSRETLTLLPTEKLNQKSVLEFVHNRYNKLILESPATPQAIRAWKTKWSLLVRDRRMFRHSKILAITVSVFVVTTGLGISYLDQLLP